MNDDIVDRLREIACYDPERPNLPTGPLAGLLIEAAGEIERLNARLGVIRDLCYSVFLGDDKEASADASYILGEFGETGKWVGP